MTDETFWAAKALSRLKKIKLLVIHVWEKRINEFSHLSSFSPKSRYCVTWIEDRADTAELKIIKTTSLRFLNLILTK